ncbi:hypothetical protein D3C87_1562240 [compost metagenome]
MLRGRRQPRVVERRPIGRDQIIQAEIMRETASRLVAGIGRVIGDGDALPRRRLNAQATIDKAGGRSAQLAVEGGQEGRGRRGHAINRHRPAREDDLGRVLDDALVVDRGDGGRAGKARQSRFQRLADIAAIQHRRRRNG